VKDRFDEIVGRWLGSWMRVVHANARSIAWGGLVLALLLGVYAGLNLGINSNNLELLSEDMPSRQNHARFAALFPNLENALLVVVDGETPELARDSAEALEKSLSKRTQSFTDTYLPGGGSFFERNGLLYRSVDELDEFADRIAGIQPIIAELEQDASLGNLTRLVRLGLESVRDGTTAGTDWPRVLERVGQATVNVYAEYPLQISWEEILLEGSSIDMATRRVIVVHPILEFGNVFAAGAATDAVREEAQALGLVPEKGVTVRVTGNPALNFEEMAGILWDVFVGGLFCFSLVVVILWFALRSWRIVVAAVSTLLIGLVFTAAFAAVAVGFLNIVSLAVAILFIGLGVDFGIHLGTRYAELMRGGRASLDAMIAAVEDIGGSLVLCMITTAIGFLVFVPTDYRGVAQLGLIAGASMVIILALTLTYFPALLFAWLPVDADRDLRRDVTFSVRWWAWFDAHPGAVRATAAVAAVAAVIGIGQARFDPNVIDLRDPSAESVQAFNDLLSEAGNASPWYVDAIEPDLESAQALAAKFEALDLVSHTITYADYVPSDQDEKLEILDDIAFLLDPPPASVETRPEPSTEEQVAALRDLHEFLGAEWIEGDRSPLGASIVQLRARLTTFLARLDGDGTPEEALASFEEILLAGLPSQLQRLRAALSPDEITLESLPEELTSRMIARDGSVRLQIFPEEDLNSEIALESFVEAILGVDPRTSGIAVNLVAFQEATQSSFLQALATALSLIALLLLALWRRVSDMLLVLAPLLLSAGLAVASMGLIDMAFNFINVIVIPLMFGIGVDSGIHLVHRSNQVASLGEGLLGTTTARAVFYSALTTTVSFGSLALSSHRGMASMGTLLTIGMILTVVCNLIVLPALLALRAPRETTATPGAAPEA
jgi:hopanoid biosynthesis associated RND transporter like protein HpnN